MGFTYGTSNEMRQHANQLCKSRLCVARQDHEIIKRNPISKKCTHMFNPKIEGLAFLEQHSRCIFKRDTETKRVPSNSYNSKLLSELIFESNESKTHEHTYSLIRSIIRK